MSITEQCNLLKHLYEKKYFRPLSHSNNATHIQDINGKTSGLKQRKNHIYMSQSKKICAADTNKNIYNIQYCNQPIQLKLDSYRQFSIQKQRRKAKSAAASHQKFNSSQRSWVNNKNLNSNSRESHYLNLLLQHQNKINVQRSISNHIHKNIQTKYDTFNPLLI